MSERESRLTSFRRWLHQDRFRYWLTFAVAWATLQLATTPLRDRSWSAALVIAPLGGALFASVLSLVAYPKGRRRFVEGTDMGGDKVADKTGAQ